LCDVKKEQKTLQCNSQTVCVARSKLPTKLGISEVPFRNYSDRVEIEAKFRTLVSL